VRSLQPTTLGGHTAVAYSAKELILRWRSRRNACSRLIFHVLTLYELALPRSVLSSSSPHSTRHLHTVLTQRLFPLSARVTPVPLALGSFIQRRDPILCIDVVLWRCESDLTEDMEVECFLAERQRGLLERVVLQGRKPRPTTYFTQKQTNPPVDVHFER
jgi:hypothetical protein